jgi:phage terminase large subunit-like protein
MTDPRLLGPSFSGSSWDTWRSVLKATFAEPMTEAEVATFNTVAGGRNIPQQRVAEAVYIVGRGGGKDSVASLIATSIAVNFNPRGKLRPGELATIICIAVDRDQAKIVYNYVKAYFTEVPALAAMVRSIEKDSIILTNRVEIMVETNSYRSVRGRSFLAAIFDELAFWRSEGSAVPDKEVANAVGPGLTRVPGSMRQS